MLPGMMPILHSLGVRTPGQLGPMRRDFEPSSARFTLHHVEHRNAFGDADDERDAGVDRFQDGIGGERRRHIDRRRVGAGRGDGVRARVSNSGTSASSASGCLEPPLPGVTPPTMRGAVGLRLLGVERALGCR